ncbi:MAG: PQQ-binding-like beta-propeller repeat protein [Myxococcota bacterium]
MIRFRIGQSWKRERAAAPVDSLGLELDGIELFPGANEEPLGKVVPELVAALHALAVEGRPTAALSLTEAYLEVALHRQGEEVVVRVVSLTRPARLLRPPLRLELGELAAAAARCARGYVNDLCEVAPKLLQDSRHRALMRRLVSLERGRFAHVDVGDAREGWSHRLAPTLPTAFGLELNDSDGLLLAYTSKTDWPLPSLLFDGELWLSLRGQEVWRSHGPPFLFALELSRQAAELAAALEAGEARLTLHLAGSPVSLTVEQADFEPLIRAMWTLPQTLALAVCTRNRAQRKNPYWVELVKRCREGLLHLKGAVQPAAGEQPARRKKNVDRRPLKSAGKLRRLRFEPKWQKSSLGGEGPGRLLLSPRGPIFSSPQLACGFTPEGQLSFRRVATHGVAAATSGQVLTATLTRVLAFFGGGGSARWLKDHDGLPLGPELFRQDGVLLASANHQGVIAFCELTGRELWRLVPPRTQRGYLALHARRLLLSTDSGYLYGLDVGDGQVRFRMKGALPFAAPPISWGKKLVAVMSRGERTAVFVADAHVGHIAWTKELQLSSPSVPLVMPSRVLIAGRVDASPTLVCLSAKGTGVWVRPLPLSEGPLSLWALSRSTVLVQDGQGAAVAVESDGRIEWRLGAAGEALSATVAPKLARGVLLVAGETVRAVEPGSGRVLAQVRAGSGLCDLAVDGKLNLYLLDEAGTLTALRLGSHFAVV